MQRHLSILFFCLVISFFCTAQRQYAAHSVLASGSWYKLGVSAPGVYKIDIPLLNGLGVNVSGLSSASIRLFGNGGAMLTEKNNGPWTDDLQELAITVVDGGDGQLNGSDYIIFYADGPHKWEKDSINQRFSYKKNLYTEKAFYYLSIGGAGKRIGVQTTVGFPNTTVSQFTERIVHELDTVNFLASGKEWYGEEFTNAPGKLLTRDFSFTVPGMVTGTPLQLKSQVVSRSVGAPSRFDIIVNTQPVAQFSVPATGSGVYDVFAREVSGMGVTNTTTGNIRITFTYIPGSFNAQGWLNRFELSGRRDLSLNSVNQLLFRDWASVGPNNNGEFIISTATAATKSWDITDPTNPVEMAGSFSAGSFRFINSCARLREYVAFNGVSFLVPTAEGRVNNQDLHNTSPADFIILTDPSLLGQANRVAELHRQRHAMRVTVVTTDQVYNEFASGAPDPVAIRDFIKMYHDKYGTMQADKLKYLLLFGDASYDYKNRIAGNTNLVPAWQNEFSLDPLSTYASDDFFGFLDDNEDINSGVITNLLDIGIGRVPAKNETEAKNFTDKVEAYLSAQSLGPWRNNISLIADDEDNNLHLQDAELFSATVSATAPLLNQQKIYMDAYRQVTVASGSSYPQANEASNNAVYKGTLIWNYNGHGGFTRLAEENILDQSIVNGFDNPARLPLFITATCDFAPYDNPQINSLGENILLRPKTGAIALMTTTRLVFAFSNRVMNNNYLQLALQPTVNGQYKTLGDAVREAKNFTYQNSADITNNRKFTLLGDPALTLAFPSMIASATRVNGIAIATADTLSATENVLIEGEVTDRQGNLLSNFSGNVYPVVFDKPQPITTLANDPGSAVASFPVQRNILFSGKSTVTAGRFAFGFKVPRDINYQFGKGKISLYAENGVMDAAGYTDNIVIGGAGSTAVTDQEGPVIKGYLNDELFVNGGTTNQQPVLLVKLADSSGINTTSTGIGHDIVATLDNNNNTYFILNDFYESELNSYQRGVVRFRLPVLAPGPHTLHLKAWDVLNNSSETVLDFIVADDQDLSISHVLNYPNPFTTKTMFWFEHNKPGLPLEVQIQIMTVSGRTVKNIKEEVVTAGNRSASISWDGRDDYGDKVGRGVYIYRLRVRQGGKKYHEVVEKLVIL